MVDFTVPTLIFALGIVIGSYTTSGNPDANPTYPEIHVGNSKVASSQNVHLTYPDSHHSAKSKIQATEETNSPETSNNPEMLPNIQLNKELMVGFGRVLTWNVKKFSSCSNQDNTEHLKKVICTVLQSASIVILQEASNLNFSCLPCVESLRREYQWSDDDSDTVTHHDFKILVKTADEIGTSFRTLKEGSCKSGRPTSPLKSESTTLIKPSNLSFGHVDDASLMEKAEIDDETKLKPTKAKVDSSMSELLMKLNNEKTKGETNSNMEKGKEYLNNNFNTSRVSDGNKQAVTNNTERMSNGNIQGAQSNEYSKGENQNEQQNNKEEEGVVNNNLKLTAEPNAGEKQSNNKEEGVVNNNLKLTEPSAGEKQNNKEGERIGNIAEKFEPDVKKEDRQSAKEKDSERNRKEKLGVDFKNLSNKFLEGKYEDDGEHIIAIKEKVLVENEKGNGEEVDVYKKIGNDNPNNNSSPEEKHNNKQAGAENKTDDETRLKPNKVDSSMSEILNNKEAGVENKTPVEESMKNQHSQNKQEGGEDTALEKSVVISKDLLNVALKMGDDVKGKNREKRPTPTANNEAGDEDGALQKLKNLLLRNKDRLQSLNAELQNEKYACIAKRLKNIEVEINQLDQVEEDSVSKPSKKSYADEENQDQTESPPSKTQTIKSTPSEVTKSLNSLKGIDLGSNEMKNIIRKVLSENISGMKRIALLSKFTSLGSSMKSVEEEISGSPKKRLLKRYLQKLDLLSRRQKNTIARRQHIFSAPIVVGIKVHYKIVSVTSPSYNKGLPFLVINLRFPKDRELQSACIKSIKEDILESQKGHGGSGGRRRRVFITGDFHFDAIISKRLTKMLENFQIDGTLYDSVMRYRQNDPITTVFGRRYDNIITNGLLREKLQVNSPEVSALHDSLFLSVAVQRLYNNYITNLYSSQDDAIESSYKCIRALQSVGKSVLSRDVCKASWVPSTYVSDHLPLEVTVKISDKDQVTASEFKFSTWNIQGDTFKERLEDDPDIWHHFVEYMTRSQVVIFNNYFTATTDDLKLDELGGKIVRLKQNEEETEFAIYINKNNREVTSDSINEMFVLQQKQQGHQPDSLISTVGLFTPSLVVDGRKITPCFYTLHNEGDLRGDFSKIMGAIEGDMKNRRTCEFRVLLAHLSVEDGVDLGKLLYDKYQYQIMDCRIWDGQKRYRYNVPRTRTLTDYVIVLDHNPEIKFPSCQIMLPGDENRRGIHRVSDFEELSTHYPLSAIFEDAENDTPNSEEPVVKDISPETFNPQRVPVSRKSEGQEKSYKRK